MQSFYAISDMMIFENAQVAQFMYTNCVNAGYSAVEKRTDVLDGELSSERRCIGVL